MGGGSTEISAHHQKCIAKCRNATIQINCDRSSSERANKGFAVDAVGGGGGGGGGGAAAAVAAVAVAAAIVAPYLGN